MFVKILKNIISDNNLKDYNHIIKKLELKFLGDDYEFNLTLFNNQKYRGIYLINFPTYSDKFFQKIFPIKILEVTTGELLRSDDIVFGLNQLIEKYLLKTNIPLYEWIKLQKE